MALDQTQEMSRKLSLCQTMQHVLDDLGKSCGEGVATSSLLDDLLQELLRWLHFVNKFQVASEGYMAVWKRQEDLFYKLLAFRLFIHGDYQQEVSSKSVRRQQFSSAEVEQPDCRQKDSAGLRELIDVYG